MAAQSGSKSREIYINLPEMQYSNTQVQDIKTAANKAHNCPEKMFMSRKISH